MKQVTFSLVMKIKVDYPNGHTNHLDWEMDFGPEEESEIMERINAADGDVRDEDCHQARLDMMALEGLWARE